MSTTVKGNRKQYKTALYILLTYIFVFQLSSLLLLLPGVHDIVFGLIDAPDDQKGAILVG